MNWVKWLLLYIKDIIIIVLAIMLMVLWTKVPDYKLDETEDNHAPKQSKRST